MTIEPSANVPIPMLDLQSEVEELWSEIMDAIQRVLRSGQFVLGPEVEAFEEEVAAFLGVEHAVAVNSGTDALVIGLRAAGIGPGDEVITTAFTFYATVEAILLVGATPVFVDIAETGFNLDVGAIAGAVTDRTKAVIPVHLFGEPVAMGPLLELAESRDLLILEDCAQAFGAYHEPSDLAIGDARTEPARVGSLGHVAAFSLYPTKNLGAYGDGGLIVTDDAELTAAARSLRNHAAARERRYVHQGVGYNSRLDALQAAILRVKLPHVDRWNALRRSVALRYEEAFKEIEGVRTPPFKAGHVFHQYTLAIDGGRRDSVQSHLTGLGIASSTFYPSPYTAWPAGTLTEGQTLSRTEAASATVLSLPMHAHLGPEEQGRVIRAVLDSASST